MISYRFYLTDAGAEREVSKEEWIQAERDAGFLNWKGRPEDPATAFWSSGHMSGRVEYVTGAS